MVYKKTVFDGITEDFKQSGTIYAVPPDIICVVNGWNPRTDFSGEDELVSVIKAGGYIPPMIVRKFEGRLELVDGERRLRAYLRAKAEGAEIARVPIIVTKKGESEINLFFSAILANGGKSLKPSEEATAYRRFINWNVTIAEIANMTGKSIGHIRNRLELAEASPDVKKAVDAKEIPIADAQAIAKKSQGSIDRQNSALEKRKAEPKKRKLVYSFKNGKVVATGNKDNLSEIIQRFLSNYRNQDAIAHEGFDPESIRLTIDLS